VTGITTRRASNLEEILIEMFLALETAETLSMPLAIESGEARFSCTECQIAAATFDETRLTASGANEITRLLLALRFEHCSF
jgi:hypothetical protein